MTTRTSVSGIGRHNLIPLTRRWWSHLIRADHRRIVHEGEWFAPGTDPLSVDPLPMRFASGRSMVRIRRPGGGTIFVPILPREPRLRRHHATA